MANRSTRTATVRLRLLQGGRWGGWPDLGLALLAAAGAGSGLRLAAAGLVGLELLEPQDRSRVLISIARPLDNASPTEASRQWAELFELLARCERLLRDELAERTSPQGLSEAQFSLLWACRQAPPGGLSQNELAQSLALSAAHVSGQVEQLRAKGLLAGYRRAPDRRRQVWQLTDQGHQRFESLLDELVGWFGELESRLSPPRRADLAELLRLLATSLDANLSAPPTAATAPKADLDNTLQRGTSA